jgi:hypothetical protein
MARQCKRLFQAAPMPELQSPVWVLPTAASLLVPAFAAAAVTDSPFVIHPH